MAENIQGSRRYEGDDYSPYAGPEYPNEERRLHRAVEEALMNDLGAEGEDIQIEVDEGIVTLTGWVESRQIKKEAQMAIEPLPGVKDIVNLIKVQEFSQKEGRGLIKN